MVVGHNPSVSTDLYNVYVQTGWIRFNSTEHPPRNRVFLEMGTVVNGVHNPERWMLSTPLLSGTKEYKIEQTDKDAGEWTVYYDADSWGSEAKDYWESIVGKQARNKGEIHKLESDMPGINSNRCVLEGLQYRLEGGASYIDQDTFPNSSSDNPSKWGHNKVSETKVEIWDKVDDCP